jgi:hypothetical protein
MPVVAPRGAAGPAALLAQPVRALCVSTPPLSPAGVAPEAEPTLRVCAGCPVTGLQGHSSKAELCSHRGPSPTQGLTAATEHRLGVPLPGRAPVRAGRAGRADDGEWRVVVEGFPVAVWWCRGWVPRDPLRVRDKSRSSMSPVLMSLQCTNDKQQTITNKQQAAYSTQHTAVSHACVCMDVCVCGVLGGGRWAISNFQAARLRGVGGRG